MNLGPAGSVGSGGADDAGEVELGLQLDIVAVAPRGSAESGGARVPVPARVAGVARGALGAVEGLAAWARGQSLLVREGGGSGKVPEQTSPLADAIWKAMGKAAW